MSRFDGWRNKCERGKRKDDTENFKPRPSLYVVFALRSLMIVAMVSGTSQIDVSSTSHWTIIHWRAEQ